MKIRERHAGLIVAEISLTELLAINNALNEVCNGLDIADAEFQTRLGVHREEARAVLAAVNAALSHSG